MCQFPELQNKIWIGTGTGHFSFKLTDDRGKLFLGNIRFGYFWISWPPWSYIDLDDRC